MEEKKMYMEFTLEQAQALVEAFGGDDKIIMSVVHGGRVAHSGEGLYVHCVDYPEAGSNFLGKYP